MVAALLPAEVDDVASVTDPQAVVEGFLHALSVPDLDKAVAFAAEDIHYVNVGLPPVDGKRALHKFLKGLERPNGGFEVYLHAISTDGPVVLTERTDVIKFGSFRAQFWVCGRFEVHDGKITVWRDYFDYLDIARGTVRGLLGIVAPSLRPKAPSIGDTPGR